MREGHEAAYAFGSFLLDGRRRVLTTRSGQAVPLGTKAFDALLCLVKHRGEVVTKDALMRTVWAHICVEVGSVSQCIHVLRKALGEDPREHRFIVTVAGRGYRFVAPVETQPAEGAAGVTVGTPPLATQRRSLAVLPFKPLNASPHYDSMMLGMAEALIARIASLPDIDVRPLSSVCRYGRVEQDPIEAGKSLDVTTVLDGYLQQDGKRLRASARLLDVKSGRQLWTDRYDAGTGDIFSIQDAIAERVAAAVHKTLTARERERLLRHPTNDALAYQLYVNGWSAFTRPGGGTLLQGLNFLEEAVRRDPAFALAQARVGTMYSLLGVFGVRAPHEVFPHARSAVMKAIEVDPDLAEAHAELGHIYTVYDLDWRRAIAAYRRALEIDPRCVYALHCMGLQLIGYGALDEALHYLQAAQSLEPLAGNLNANIGMIHYFAGRYETAVAQLEATLELDETFDHARGFLGRALLRLGEHDRAIEHFHLCGNVTVLSASDLPAAYALSGRKNQARRELEQLLERSKSQYIPAYDVATVYAALEDTDAALDWLERAVEQRSQPVNFLLVDPTFARLRDAPRFRAVLQQLGAPTDKRG
jgi:DNA-binding winged helix-turn-helix (wHTH) protein/tetratricopeptide (TPR) repeat protein